MPPAGSSAASALPDETPGASPAAGATGTAPRPGQRWLRPELRDGLAREAEREEAARRAVPTSTRLLMWGGLVVLGALFLVFAYGQQDSAGLDMKVYWRAAQVLHGLNPEADDLYAPSLVEAGALELPFTYPPAAALLFYPLGGMGLEQAWSAMRIANGVLLLAFAGVALRLAPFSRRWFLIRPVPTLLGYAAVLGLAWELYPVWFTYVFGQINLLLAVLILADLGRRRAGGTGTGFLTGLASGIKVTPAAMGLVPLVQGQWRTILGMLVGVAVSILGAALVLPREVLDYFTVQLWSTGRVGDDGRIGNQSLNGLVQMWGVPESLASPLWLVLVVAIIVLGGLGIRRTARAGDRFSATVLGALVMLLISPISWEHHWVWVLPLLLALVPERPREAPGWEWAVSALLGLVLVVAFGDNPSVMAAEYLGDHGAGVVFNGPPALERLGTVPILASILAGAWLALRPRAARCAERDAVQDGARS
ncbi:glycosyltransferase 87 family protein [Kocuria palustris]|uniref:glycosyltransferase 87 family protein n=1 Tax=Kocuria palustris TaxID=71999 RepID=UPI0011A26A7A|nr:glycosyltransferase 87 family protein [Kocuria palustris]